MFGRILTRCIVYNVRILVIVVYCANVGASLDAMISCIEFIVHRTNELLRDGDHTIVHTVPELQIR
jgi:hypothetical protein